MIIITAAFILTIILILIFEKTFRVHGWVDNPTRYGHARAAVPYSMGFIFSLVFILLAFFFLEFSPQLLAVLFSGGLLTIMAFIDDWKNLSAMLRFSIQILLAGIVVFSGTYAPAISNPFGQPVVLDSIQWQVSLGSWEFMIIPLAFLFAILWIVFATNAMNWLDGSPGIVSGTAAISSLVIYFLASEKIHVIDQSTLGTVALIIAGSSIAFLIFDFAKPRVLMGDSGTMFLGFMIAIMAIFSGAKFATVFIVLGIPLLDAIWTIGRRMVNGTSPFRGDFQHLHHDLLKAGFTGRQVNFFYYAVSLSFGLVSLFLHSFGKLIAIGALLILMTAIRTFIAFSKLSSHPDP